MHTHQVFFSSNLQPFVLLDPRRREMVGSQVLAPSQCSVGLVNTTGCADGDLPGNGVPKTSQVGWQVASQLSSQGRGWCDMQSPDTVLESLPYAGDPTIPPQPPMSWAS